MSFSMEMPAVVRPSSSWRSALLLAVVTFILTILAMQLWGQIRTQAMTGMPEKHEPVTALIEQCPSVFPPISSENPTKFRLTSSASTHCTQAPASAKTILQLKEQLTAPEMLRQAWRDFSSSTGNSVDFNSPQFHTTMNRFRQSLEVKLGDSPRGGKCLQLSLVWPNPGEAALLLKILGEHYANQYRTGWQAAREKEYDHTKSAVLQTGQALDDAIAQYDFWEACFSWKSPTPKPANADRPDNSPLSNSFSPPTLEKTAPPRNAIPQTENPAWIDLQKELSTLHEKETRLLEKRTALHPEVKYLQEQIRASQAQLALIPHWLNTENSLRSRDELATAPLRTPPEIPTEIRPGLRTEPAYLSENNHPNQTTAVPALKSQAAREVNDEIFLAQLASQVQTAAEAYHQALACEKLASQDSRLPPTIAVRTHEPILIAAVAPSRHPVAWWAGALMAVAVGLIFTGKSIEPPVASLKELHRFSAVPIVGVVPSYTPAIDPRIVKRRKYLLRFALFLSGLSIVGICFAAMVVFARF